jgi:hypothetical protein
MDTKDMPALDRKMFDDINSITAELEQGKLVQSISEEVFVKTFLPMFAEDADRDPRINVSTWLNLAHGPFNEVNVVDNQRGDEVLFTVPPLHDRNYIKPLDGNGPEANMSSLTHVMMHAEKLGKRGMNVMNNYIDSELSARAFMFGDKKINPDFAKRWLDIFTRYGRKLPEHFSQASAAVKASEQGGAAAVDYDIL